MVTIFSAMNRHRKHITVTLSIFMLFSCCLCAQEKGPSPADLEKQLPHLQGKKRLAALAKLTNVYSGKAPPQAIRLGKEALAMLDHTGKSKTKIKVLLDISIAYVLTSKYKTAMEHLHQAESLIRETGAKHYLWNLNFAMGFVCFHGNDYGKAQNYCLESLKIAEAQKDPVKISDSLNSLGALYNRLKNYPKALGYFQRYLDMAKKEGNRNAQAVAYNNIGNNYEGMGDLDLALENYRKSMLLAGEMGNKLVIGYAYSNLGDVYNKKGDYSRALAFYQQSEKISRELDDKQGIAISLSKTGSLYRKTGRLKEGLELENRALQMAEKMNQKPLMAASLLELSFIHAIMGDHRRSDHFYKQHRTLKDKVYNEELNKKIAEMQTKYEMGKMEQKIKNLEGEKTFGQLELQQQETMRKLLIAIVAVLVGFVLLLISRYHLKRRANREIRQKNADLRRALDKLEEADSEIKELTGLIPVCANCKKVRDDTGYWHQVEDYFKHHHQADVSRGLCPHCAQEIYSGDQPQVMV